METLLPADGLIRLSASIYSINSLFSDWAHVILKIIGEIDHCVNEVKQSTFCQNIFIVKIFNDYS